MDALLQPESDLAVREKLIDEAATDNFVELISIAGLDPKKHLRFADWSGVDFGGSDLRGFDFTGARLIACNFLGARIEGARFDQALIDEVRPGARLDPRRTDLPKARDWISYVNSWKKADRPAPEHLPPGSVFQDAPFAPEMVVVPPGRFWMGSKDREGFNSERPQHEVTIPQALAVGRFPVTFYEWEAARAAGAVEPKPTGRESHPVTRVSWDEAQTYVSWLSRVTDRPYRLLSEAEWEYACRAGRETAYSLGDALTETLAHLRKNGHPTVEVGLFPANGFGVCDMHQNVWEWCEDRWNKSYRAKPEGIRLTGEAWTIGESRVLRGGPCDGTPRVARAARRGMASNSILLNDVGFRVARRLLAS